MKRTLLALALALSFVAPAIAAPTANLAPADRYFGRLKMSILGVRNSLKDLSERAVAQVIAKCLEASSESATQF